MAVNETTDALVQNLLRNQIKPSSELNNDDNTGQINDELKNIEDVIRLLAENSMQSADTPPVNPKRGQIRYAVSPWNPVGSGNGPVFYNGSAWVTLIGATGSTGSTGSPGNNANSSNNTQIFLYQVNTSSSTAPSTVSGNFTYDFSDATIVTQSGANFNGWSTSIPTVPQGSFLWVISAYAVASTETVTVAASSFTTAKVMAASGSDGSTGTQGIQGNPGVNAVDGDDGRSVAQLQIFKRSSSAITSAPTGGSFNFSSQALTPPTGWSTSVPSGTDAIYTSLASAQVVGNTGTDSSLTWSTPVVLSQNGINGDPGSNGKSTFQALIFQRATSAPSSPSGGSFNFGTNALTAPSGWSTSIPSGSDPIYVCNFQFSITGDTGSQTAGTWGTVRLMAQDGSDGDDGRSTYLATVFRRDANTPTLTSGGEYNFTTNTLTAPSGWYTYIPSGTNILYAATALASVLGPTGTDTSLSWTVGKLAQDGATGATGLKSTSGLIYYEPTSTLRPATPVPSNSVCVYSFSSSPPGFGSSLPTYWSEEAPTVNTQDTGSYWQSKYNAVEATPGGSVTVTVSTPTKVFTFDGIVRFSNTNSRNLYVNHTGGTTTTTSVPAIFRQAVGNSTQGYTFPNSKNIGDILYATDWGYTTFISTVAGSSTNWVKQDLATAINNNNNTTTINGGNITTGTITAEELNISDVQGEVVTAAAINGEVTIPKIFRQNIGNSSSGFSYPSAVNAGDILYAIDWADTTYISTQSGTSHWVRQDLASAINNANNTTKILGGTIQSGTITANEINTSSVQAAVVTATAINAQDINAGSITTGSLTLNRLTVSGAADGQKLSFNSSSGTAEWKDSTTSTTFNSSGSYTVPGGHNFVVIQIWGSGGNGNSVVGGGGGAYQRLVFLASDIGGAITVTVGTGGQGNNTYSSVSFSASIGVTAEYKCENGNNGSGPSGPEDQTQGSGGTIVTSSHSLWINRIAEDDGHAKSTTNPGTYNRSYTGTGGRNSSHASFTTGIGGRGGNSISASGAAPGGGGAYGSGSGAAGRVIITVS
jgi:hypothetical protein